MESSLSHIPGDTYNIVGHACFIIKTKWTNRNTGLFKLHGKFIYKKLLVDSGFIHMDKFTTDTQWYPFEVEVMMEQLANHIAL